MSHMLNGSRQPLATAVFISGSGSTLQALLEMQHQINIKLVVSNRQKILGSLKAKRFGVSYFKLDKKMSDQELTNLLNSYVVKHIILAGYMKILSAEFVQMWAGQITNIHPSLLPNYKGLSAAERSWDDGSDMGVTIHRVTEVMDDGEILLQKKSKTENEKLNLAESLIWLRQTEQHLLRQYCR